MVGCDSLEVVILVRIQVPQPIDMTVIPLIKKILEYRNTGTAIDIGAGQGHHSIFLAEQGFTVTALDADASLVKKLSEEAKERNLPLVAKVGDVRELEGQWDVVVCTFVLHFLQDNEVEKAINILKKITKSGGLNVIGVHTTENGAERDRKPHLFELNELKDRYADWKILYYWHGLGKAFVSRTTGEKLAKYRADLISQKP